MDHVILTAAWMTFNVFLAFIPVVFAQVTVKSKNKMGQLIAGVVWFFFLPNTIYLLTDIINLQTDFGKISGVHLIANIFIYLILIPIGIITYVLSIYPFEKKIKNKNWPAVLLALNFLVGLGMVLGRVQRVNSWEIITNIQNVITKSIEIFNSPQLILMAFIFGITCQIIYVFFKKPVVRRFGRK